MSFSSYTSATTSPLYVYIAGVMQENASYVLVLIFLDVLLAVLKMIVSSEPCFPPPSMAILLELIGHATGESLGIYKSLMWKACQAQESPGEAKFRDSIESIWPVLLMPPKTKAVSARAQLLCLKRAWLSYGRICH